MTHYEFAFLTIEGERASAEVEAPNIIAAMNAFKADKRVGTRPVLAIRIAHGDGSVGVLGERKEAAEPDKAAKKKAGAKSAKGR